MVQRPEIRLNSRKSCSSFTELAWGSTLVGCWALTGCTPTSKAKSASVPTTMRNLATSVVMAVPPMRLELSTATARRPPSPARSSRDGLAIGGLPAPGARAVATLDDALFVDLRNNVAIAGQQRLGRAHLGAKGQLALREPIGAVFV